MQIATIGLVILAGFGVGQAASSLVLRRHLVLDIDRRLSATAAGFGVALLVASIVVLCVLGVAGR